MKIAVIGGGNVGTLIAGQLSYKGYDVSLYTRDVSRWAKEIIVYDYDTNIEIKTSINLVTDDLEKCVKGVDFIIITVPVFGQKEIIKKFEQMNLKNTIICFYPGTGGSEFLCAKLLNNNVTICGTQRICSVARLDEYGYKVHTAGKREKIYIGCIPQHNGEKVRKIFENLFEIKTELLPNYLCVTLVPSNPILHPSRLYNLFKNYTIGDVYKKIPLFYEDWDDDSSKTLIACDNELHQILTKILELDTSKIMPLLEHYESTNYKELTKKIKSIESFKGLETPSIKLKAGFIPNLESRYFTADIPYGLLIIKDFAIILGVKTPNIDKVINWYQRITNKYYLKDNCQWTKETKDLNLPSNYGINDLKSILDFYKGE